MTSTGSCRSTPPSCGHISTPPGREKGAPEPGARSLAGRADQQTALGRRRPGPTAGSGPHRREHKRPHPVHRPHGRDTSAPDRAGTAPSPSRSRPRGQGLQLKAIRDWLRRRGIGHTIPERADQVANRLRRGRLGGRPVVFDRQLYKQRNVVERTFNRLKQWRGMETRYGKTAESYRAAVTIASLLMWA